MIPTIHAWDLRLLSKKQHDQFDVVKQSVDRSIRAGDIILFVVLGLLAFMFVGFFLFPSPHPPHSEASGMGEIMTIFFSAPIVCVAVIIGLIKYRLWRSWLFWILLVISAFAVFTRALIPNSSSEDGVRNARIVAALLAPLVAVPLWQLIMGVSMAVSQEAKR